MSVKYFTQEVSEQESEEAPPTWNEGSERKLIVWDKLMYEKKGDLEMILK